MTALTGQTRLLWDHAQEVPAPDCVHPSHGFAVQLDCWLHPIGVARVSLQRLDAAGEWEDVDVEWEEKENYLEVEQVLLRRHGLEEQPIKAVTPG